MKTANVLPELNWHIKCKTTSSRSEANVTVSVTKGGKTSTPGTKLITFIMRDNLFTQFDSDYVIFAVAKNRIYFKPTDNKSCYKISVKNTTGYLQATLQKNEIAEFEEFVGDYSWKYDEFYELYYIEREC